MAWWCYVIYPLCSHTVPTKADPAAKAPPATGWILTCRDDYEAAIRRNLMHFADPILAVKQEDELIALRAKIQQLESDLNDCLSARGVSFVRCACGRFKMSPFACRSCGA